LIGRSDTHSKHAAPDCQAPYPDCSWLARLRAARRSSKSELHVLLGHVALVHFAARVVGVADLQPRSLRIGRARLFAVSRRLLLELVRHVLRLLTRDNTEHDTAALLVVDHDHEVVDAVLGERHAEVQAAQVALPPVDRQILCPFWGDDRGQVCQPVAVLPLEQDLDPVRSAALLTREGQSEDERKIVAVGTSAA